MKKKRMNKYDERRLNFIQRFKDINKLGEKTFQVHNSFETWLLYNGFKMKLPAREIIFRHHLAISSLTQINNALCQIATHIEVMTRSINEDLEQYMESYYGTKHQH